MIIPLRDDNPTTITPYVTWGLIAACTFFYLVTLPGHARDLAALGYGYIPARSFHVVLMPRGVAHLPWPLTLLSYQFLHAGFLHLAGNMLYLWIFGNNVEDAMGHWRYLAFYLLCGVIAGFAHGLTVTGSLTPLVGASGAISGVLGAYLLLYPRARILCVFTVFVLFAFRIPAWLVIGFWFVMQLLMLLSGGEGNIAVAAHVAGLLSGAALVMAFRRPGVPLRVARPPRPAKHDITTAAGGGYLVRGKWFGALADAETYRRTLDSRKPVRVQRRVPRGEEPVVHHADGSYGYRGRTYATLEEAARALMQDTRRAS